jgi:hypothetical protein
MKILKFYEINEMTSATGGPAVSSGMGAVVSSQPSGFAGTTLGPNWASGGGTEGSGDISVPYNPSGSNRLFQRLKNHGPRDAKRLRRKKSLKYLKNLFSKKQDYTANQGKVMNYNNFEKDDMMKIKKDESLGTTIGAIGLAASSILKPTMPKEIPSKSDIKDTTVLQKPTSDKENDLSLFVDSIVDKYPNIIETKTLPVSVLENELKNFNIKSDSKILKFGDFETPKLTLKDLDLLSSDLFNFKINYFVVRGLDIDNKPTLIPILNLNYTNVVKVHGHDIEFNFTRLTGVNTIGAKINF